MKKFVSLLMVLTLTLALAACHTEPQETTALPEGTELQVPPSLKEPVEGDFTEETGDVVYTGELSEYQVSLGFTATVDWESFSFCLLSWETETYTVEEELFTGTLEEGKTFVAKVTFWGDMTTYGLTITDKNGHVWQYAVYMSGMDGSLILGPYGEN